MCNIRTFLAIATLALSVTANASNLFTCKLPGNKVASVSIDGSQVYYSYGKEGAQPDVQLDRTHNWFMGNNHYAGANYQLTFRVQKGNYSYVLYSQNYGDKLDEGLVAYNGTKVLFNKKCTETAKVDDSVWNAQPADFGMQTEIDQTSDFISKLDTGGATSFHDTTTDNSDNNQPTDDNNQSNQISADTSKVPVKVQIQDVPYDWKSEDFAKHTVTRHIYVYSLVDSITITGLSVDRGSCYDWNNIKPYTAAYGKRADFYLPMSESNAAANAGWNWYGGPTKYGKCMWSEIVVNTNQGNYTFNF